jgi:hypothetical protein
MYGYDSPEDLLGDLTDISRQLYVEPDRRRNFALAIRSGGRIQGFESQIYRRGSLNEVAYRGSRKQAV